MAVYSRDGSEDPVLGTILMACAPIPAASAGAHRKHDSTFQTSDRCIACHVGLIMPSGKDVSIGTDWQSSIMANSSRDPYWQASVRRESIDHPELQRTIEDECSICHMPIARFEARQQGCQGEVFTHLPLDSDDPADRQAADGVSCSVCHQISKEKLGTRESFNGGFVIDKPESKGARPEYGPFDIEKGQTRIMQTSTGGLSAERPQAYPAVGTLRNMPHAVYQIAGSARKGIGRVPRADAVSGVAAQRFRDKQSCQ